MKCPMCYKEIPDVKLVAPYKVHQPDTGAESEVCGVCFLLINILDKLEEIKECLR